LLSNLARRDCVLQEELGRRGACEAVAEALRAHPHARDVQVYGAAAAGWLAGVEANRLRLLDCGACALACRAARASLPHGLRAVAALAAQPACQGPLGDAGACEVACDALRLNLAGASHETLELAALALWTVGALARRHGANQRRLREAGACMLAVRVLAAQPAAGRLQRHGWEAAAALAFRCEENKQALREAGVVAHVEALLRLPGGPPRGLELELLAAIVLCVDPEAEVLEELEERLVGGEAAAGMDLDASGGPGGMKASRSPDLDMTRGPLSMTMGQTFAAGGLDEEEEDEGS
jgi:hypothetical protein